MANNSINISLLAFDKIVSINTAGVVSSSLPSFTPGQNDPIAKVDIKLSAFKEMFAFYSDYVDVDNVLASDRLHYIAHDKIPLPGVITKSDPTFDAANGLYINSSSLVTTNVKASSNPMGGNLTAADQTIQKDYVRHLADILFSTPYGVDLFINESALDASVQAALNSAWSSCLEDMRKISNKSPVENDDDLKGNFGSKYLENFPDNHTNPRKNICSDLLNALLTSKPERFQDMTTLELSSNDLSNFTASSTITKLFSLPLLENDSIRIKVTLKPNAGQESFGRTASVITNNERSYFIDLVLKS